MKTRLQYGNGWIPVEIPSRDVTLLEPVFQKGIADEEAAFRDAVRRPIEGRPLRECIGAGERLAIVIPDITRPLVTGRLLRWTLSELSHVSEKNIKIINGTGTHRPNTPEEIAAIVGPEIVRRIPVVNHDSRDPATLAPAGKSPDGPPLFLNRDYVEADRRIVLGFIEPHFMAGFSGGYKGIFPALADIDSILHYHRAEVIGDSRSTWGRLEDNPTQDQIRANGSLVPVDFCINVTQNRERCITGFFCGDVLEAHRCGSEFARRSAMVACRRPFPIVLTTNSGYPLDQNLYQAVKGMSAAAQIIVGGGLIVAAAECREGFPEHGNFRRLMCEHESPEAVLRTIMTPGFSLCDQWEAQLLAAILTKARVGLHSMMPAEEVRRAHMEPVGNIEAALDLELQRAGRDAPVAVIPEGPMTIPYLEAAG